MPRRSGPALELATALELPATLELVAALDPDETLELVPALRLDAETELEPGPGLVASSSEQAVVTSAIRNTITTAHTFIVLSSECPAP